MKEYFEEKANREIKYCFGSTIEEAEKRVKSALLEQYKFNYILREQLKYPFKYLAWHIKMRCKSAKLRLLYFLKGGWKDEG